ncbi:hypothetical protein BT93_G0716 [Corymbia citriodora subsp. variegata]|nr:hypothetical protein BT93_G0716 [Corymbia citriodora subsp. variegata]
MPSHPGICVACVLRSPLPGRPRQLANGARRFRQRILVGVGISPRGKRCSIRFLMVKIGDLTLLNKQILQLRCTVSFYSCQIQILIIIQFKFNLSFEFIEFVV